MAGLWPAGARAPGGRGSGWRRALTWCLAGWLPISWLMAALSVSVGPLHMHRGDVPQAHGPALWGAQLLAQASGHILDLADTMSAAQARWTGGSPAGPHLHAGPAGAAARAPGDAHAHGLAHGHDHRGAAARHHHRPDDGTVIPLSPTPDADLADLLAGVALSLVGPSTMAPATGPRPAAGGAWPMAQAPCWCSHQPSLPERPPRA